MAELCPKCGKRSRHKYIALTIDGREQIDEETDWKCVTNGCEYKEVVDGP